jgi:hypothetical protein
MKTYWESEGTFHAFMTSALDGDERSASRPGRFIPRTLRGTQSRFGCGGEEKIPRPRRVSNPKTPIVQPVA